MRWIKRYMLSVVGFLLVILTACQFNMPQPFVCEDAIGCVTIAPGDPVKLGALYTLSGGSAPGGLEQARTVELAIAQRDAQWLGHAIEVQILDELCSPEGGATGALRLVADPQLVGILGTNCSSAAVTAAEIMSEAGLVMISSANSAPSLTSVGGQRGEHWQPGYFRTAWLDIVMGHGAGTFAYTELALSKAALIHGGDAYTKGLADTFRQAFTALGGDIVLEVTIDEDDTVYHPMLNAVALSGAELMFFPLTYPEQSALIVRQAREMQALHALTFIGSEGMISEAFIETAGEAGVGVYFPGPAVIDSDENDALRLAYKARYGEYPPAFYYSFTYDAVNVLFYALEAVVVQDADGTLHIGRQALRDALYATKDFPGLTGNLTCDAFGDCGAAKFTMVRLDDPAAGVDGLRANVVYTSLSESEQ